MKSLALGWIASGLALALLAEITFIGRELYKIILYVFLITTVLTILSIGLSLLTRIGKEYWKEETNRES